MTMLVLEDVVAAYDDVVCLSGVSLEVRRGEIVTLIGANGAGKSTTLKTVSGLLAPRAGRIAFGRAMMSGPKLLMLDEPSLGLAPLMVEEVMRSIRAFREFGVTVLLIEQNANLALRLADRGYVMETGRIVMAGSGAELLADEHVRTSYLGAKARM